MLYIQHVIIGETQLEYHSVSHDTTYQYQSRVVACIFFVYSILRVTSLYRLLKHLKERNSSVYVVPEFIYELWSYVSVAGARFLFNLNNNSVEW